VSNLLKKILAMYFCPEDNSGVNDTTYTADSWLPYIYRL